MGNYDEVVWLLLSLGPLLFVQRWVHREIMAVLLLLIRRQEIALVIFSILFFPGVILHETSHYIVARVLSVRTGKFSILPKIKADRKLRLGYVETASTDILRDTVIGTAPIVLGGFVIAFIGFYPLNLSILGDSLINFDFNDLLEMAIDIFNQPDFWLWFYLAFTVSSTMFPSASDRRAWLPLALVVAVLMAVVVFFGAGPWLVERLSGPMNRLLRSTAVVFTISLAIHLIVLIPMAILRRMLSRLLGLEVV